MNQKLTLQLQQWFVSKPGQALWQYEQHRIEPILTQTFGYLAIQVGLPQINFLANSPIQKKLIVASFGESSHSAAYPCIQAQACQLPLQEQSVDLLILPHTLEYHEETEAILREAHRVLINEGKLIILGFNPLSLSRLRQFYRKAELSPIPLKQQISQHKLKDWVKLAGFELEHTSQSYSVQRKPLLLKTAWLKMDKGIYVINARKRSVGLRLVGPAISKQKKAPQQVPVLTSSSLNSKHISQKNSS